MKIRMIVILCCVFVVGCGSETQDSEQTASSGDTPARAAPSEKGSFKGRVGENVYAVDVKCSSLNQRYFNFMSDQTGEFGSNNFVGSPGSAIDSNGDGLIIFGLQNTDDFILTIIDNGVTYTANRLSTFEKSATGAQGSGTLFEESALESYPAEFSVRCQ